MRITHDRICIRNAERDDCGQLAAWWNDGAVMAHAGFPLGLGVTPEAVERQIAARIGVKYGVALSCGSQEQGCHPILDKHPDDSLHCGHIHPAFFGHWRHHGYDDPLVFFVYHGYEGLVLFLKTEKGVESTHPHTVFIPRKPHFFFLKISRRSIS